MVLYTQIKGKPDRRKHKTCQTDGHEKYNNYPLRKSKKEEKTMTTRTQNDVRNFNEAISKCIFTCDLEDEMIMMRYLLNRAA